MPYHCPICKKEMPYMERYPKMLCIECSKQTKDAKGRELEFYNTHPLGGGFGARYKDTKEKYDSHLCYINGIECWADEARFGGIVVEIK